MARHYNQDKTLKTLIRSVVALPFVPTNHCEAMLDRLRDMQMNKDSPFYDSMCRFQKEYLDYFEETYIRGKFDPRIWNNYGRWEKLTNNISEAYNSKLMKLVVQVHPSPNKLMVHLVSELIEMERIIHQCQVSNWHLRAQIHRLVPIDCKSSFHYFLSLVSFQRGQPPLRRESKVYVKIAKRRKNLMENYMNGDIEALFFLKQMGGIALGIRGESLTTDAISNSAEAAGNLLNLNIDLDATLRYSLSL